MSHALTRRGLVAVAPAAVVAATVPAFAGAHPDAALLALIEPYERTLAVMEVEGVPHHHAEEAYFAMKTAEPDRDDRSLRKASGLVIADRRFGGATRANLRVIQKIADTPARTMEGVIFKARISEREDNMDADLMMSIVSDLVAMGGAHA